MIRRLIAVSILCVLLFNFGIAQKKRKLGKVTVADLEMKYYERDSTAEAIVLHDEGVTMFDASSGGFKYDFRRKIRIKILKEDGLNYANFNIPLYFASGAREDLGRLKATTYNLENGKVVKTKMPRSSKFREEVSKGKTLVKLTLPEVKVGSIINIEYSVKSDFTFNLQEWYFQREIPVVYSYYYMSAPDVYKYKLKQSGYESFQFFENSAARSYTFGTKGGKMDSQDRTYTFIAENVPAFKNKGYLACADDYITKIEFEIEYSDWTRYRGNFKSHTTTWEAILKDYHEASYFGERFKLSPFVTGIADEIKALGLSEDEMITEVYNRIKSQVTWNDYYGTRIKKTFRKIWNEQKGSAAEINMLFLAVLKKLEIEAYPLFISTRNNGRLYDFRVDKTKLNYVLTYVPRGDYYNIFDLTDRNCSMDILPIRCLNGKGIVLLEKGRGIKWIDVYSSKKFLNQKFVNVEIVEDGSLVGQITERAREYSALRRRYSFEKLGTDEKYLEDIKSNHTDWDIEDFELSGIEQLKEPVNIKYKLTNEDYWSGEDVLYFNPLIIGKWEENPFTEKERKFPVDFTQPIKNQINISIKLPKGYKVEEMPKSQRMALPGNAGLFMYSINIVGDKLQLIQKYELNKSMFLPDEYAGLKMFHDKIMELTNQQVVLKKVI